MNMKLLKKMLETPSVSGNELYFQKMLINELKDVDDALYTHQSLNVTHVINPASKVKVMLLAHIDEIGLIIEKIEEDGTCRMTNVGGIKPQMYMGQHVRVVKTNHKKLFFINGIIGYPKNYKSEVSVEDLVLEIGASSKEEAMALVSIGDVVVVKECVEHMLNNHITSRGLDDKIGAYIAVEVMKKVKKESSNGVYFVATVGEETTGRGSWFSSDNINPTCSISFDVASGGVKVGNGPIITIASHANSLLVKRLEDTAKKHKIPYQYSVEVSRTFTDFDTVYKMNGGTPSELISIPLRYMHSSVELCSMEDVNKIIELVSKFIIELDENVSFDPFKE